MPYFIGFMPTSFDLSERPLNYPKLAYFLIFWHIFDFNIGKLLVNRSLLLPINQCLCAMAFRLKILPIFLLTNILPTYFLPTSNQIRLHKVFHSILKLDMSIGIQHNADVRMPHQILKGFGIDSGLRHIAAIGMPTYMWRYLG